MKDITRVSHPSQLLGWHTNKQNKLHRKIHNSIQLNISKQINTANTSWPWFGHTHTTLGQETRWPLWENKGDQLPNKIATDVQNLLPCSTGSNQTDINRGSKNADQWSPRAVLSRPVAGRDYSVSDSPTATSRRGSWVRTAASVRATYAFIHMRRHRHIHKQWSNCRCVH